DIGYVDRAVDWVRHTAPGLDRPWTITVNVHPPHPPYTADPEHWQLYEGLADLPPDELGTASAQHPYTQDLRHRGGWDYSDELVRDLRQAYYGMVSYVDAELGRVMDAVDAAGLTDDTVIGYTTGRGQLLGRCGLWGKTSLYEDSVRVPLVAAGPGFDAGVEASTPVSLLDLQASLFHATGVERPAHWRGEALQTLPADDPERSVFVEYHGHGPRGSGYVIRRGDWKLIHNVAAPHQLFDLAADPEELHDRWAERPEVVAELEQELRAVCDPDAEHEAAEAFIARQLAVIEQLRAEGVTTLPWSE